MVFNALQWPLKKTHQVVWDSLLDYGRLEWQWTLMDLDIAPDVAYKDVREVSDNVWCAKDLIVTYSNIVVTWKARPMMGIIVEVPLFSLFHLR